MRMSTSDANDAAVWVQVCLQLSDSMHAQSDHCFTLLPLHVRLYTGMQPGMATRLLMRVTFSLV